MADENNRVRHLIKKYRVHFKLSQPDLVKLTDIRQSTYRGMEEGTSIVDLERINKIAKVYGLKLWEFINPEQEIPDFEYLAAKTKKLILAKGTNKNTVKYSNIQLPKNIEIVLNSGKLPKEFTPTDIWELLPPAIRDKIASIRVTDSLKKGSLSKKIEYTGKKRGHQKLYKLIKDKPEQ